jgi:signal transduction histidine kinase
LLGNAIKYSNSDSTITIKNSAKDGFVEYQIIDTGVGMSDQQLQQILNFQTIESATGTRGEKGTGLGLLLTKELLNILNGSLQIDSTPEIGTSVTFKLPLNQINTLTNQVKEKRFNRWLLN